MKKKLARYGKTQSKMEPRRLTTAARGYYEIASLERRERTGDKFCRHDAVIVNVEINELLREKV